MARKLTIEKMQQKASERGGKCLSRIYVGQNFDLEWECSSGHVWKASPGNVYRPNGTWCPYCKSPRGERICRAYFEAILGKKFPKSRPLWLKTENGTRLELDGYCEELKIAFEHQGEQHYKKSYHSNTNNKFKKIIERDKIKAKLCKDNGVILILIPELGSMLKVQEIKLFIFKELNRNSIKFCDSSEPQIDWKQVYSHKDTESFNKLKKAIRLKGGKLLSKVFLGLGEKYQIECKEGHIWKACGRDIVFGNKTWCGICSKRVKHGIKKLGLIVESKGGKLISKRYFDAHHKYSIECKKGHKWKTTASNIINRGYWCPECARNNPSTCCISIMCIETGTIFVSVADAAKKMNISRPNISRALGNKKRAVGGLHFKYQNS